MTTWTVYLFYNVNTIYTMKLHYITGSQYLFANRLQLLIIIQLFLGPLVCKFEYVY